MVRLTPGKTSRSKKNDIAEKLKPIPLHKQGRTNSFQRSIGGDSVDTSHSKSKTKRKVVTSAQVGLRPPTRKSSHSDQRDDIPPSGREMGRQRSHILTRGRDSSKPRDGPALVRRRSNAKPPKSLMTVDDCTRLSNGVQIGRQRSNIKQKVRENSSAEDGSKFIENTSRGDSSKPMDRREVGQQYSHSNVGPNESSKTKDVIDHGRQSSSTGDRLRGRDQKMIGDSSLKSSEDQMEDEWTDDPRLMGESILDNEAVFSAPRDGPHLGIMSPRMRGNIKNEDPSSVDEEILAVNSSGSDSTYLINQTSPTTMNRAAMQMALGSTTPRSRQPSPMFNYESKHDEPDSQEDHSGAAENHEEAETGGVYERVMGVVDDLKRSFTAQCMVIPATSGIPTNQMNIGDPQLNAEAFKCGMPSRFSTRRDLSQLMTESAGTDPYQMEKVKSTGDTKRGVRWDDEEDTALQARRAKRILSSKKLRPTEENKVVDEEFLNMISTCDARELSAIIKSICTDSNDKFVTMSLSQRFPHSRDKVLEKLTTARLGDLDMESKCALILVLANQNHNGEVGRYMARLWFSINQKDRVLCENELGSQVAALARRCCCQDLQAFPASLWLESEGDKLDLSSLASDNPRDLPKAVRRAGEYAVDTLAKGVLSFFPQNGHGITLIGSPILDLLMDELGIGELKAEIDWRSTQARFNDIAEFVHDIAQNIKRNPILLAFGAAWTQLDDFFKQACLPERTVDMEADVRYAVGYCFLHYVLCEAIIMGPRTCDIEFNGFNEERRSFLDKLLFMLDSEEEKEKINRETWMMNSFEKNQMLWLDSYIRSCTQTIKTGGSRVDEKLKRGMKTPSIFTLNMLEEMCENVRKGSENNASAGFELMLEPPGSRECDTALDSGPVKEWVYKSGGRYVRSGVLLYKSPFPVAWNNLFEAWSLASYSNYADSVDFIGMILPPVLSHLDPLRKEGLYLSSRLVSTYIHMKCTLCARADAKSFCTTATDFRSDVLTQLFGLVNKEAGKQYKVRVDNAIESRSSAAFKVQAEAKRIAMQSLWGTLRSAIWGAKGVKKLPEEALSKLRRMNDMIEEWGQDIGIV